MTIALAYGGALVLSGWLCAQGVATRHRARSLRHLGVQSRREGERAKKLVARLRVHRHRLVLICAVLVGVALGNLLLGSVGLLAGALAGPMLVRTRQARAALVRRDLVDRQLADAIGAIAAALRAGLSVRRAVEEAARGSDAPLRGELEAVVRRVDSGESLDTALARLDHALGLSDVGLVVTALGVHRRTGGDLPRLLAEIEKVARARREDRGAIRALTAQARSSGVVLAVLPIAFVALLSGTGGDDLGAFYRTSAGSVLLLIALCFQGLGFAWMRRIVRRVDRP